MPTTTIIDQIHKKPRFSMQESPELFSCGLTSKTGACFGKSSKKILKQKSLNANYFSFFIQLKFMKKYLKISKNLSEKTASDDH